jgi:DNA polymerase III subunit chi
LPEVLFYHLQNQPLEAVLPVLLERCLERQWKCVVRVGSAERLSALDDALWTYRDESFLPHGSRADGAPESQPILLTQDDERPNGASIVFLTDGMPLPADQAALERIILMFDGNDDEQLAAARATWKDVKARGLEATYWQQDERGRWLKKG